MGIRLLLLCALEAKDHHGEKRHPDELRYVEGEAQKQHAQHHGRERFEVGEKRRGGCRIVGETPQIAPEGRDGPDGGDVEVEPRRDEISLHRGDVRRIRYAKDRAAERYAPARDDADREVREHAFGFDCAKRPAGGGGDSPENARGREVKRRKVALRDEKRDARRGEKNGEPLLLRDGAALRMGGPVRHEKRARRHRQHRRGGVGVSNQKKEGELDPEHPEGVEGEVPSVRPVAKGGENVFAQDERFESQKKNARAREAKRREVDRVERTDSIGYCAAMLMDPRTTSSAEARRMPIRRRGRMWRPYGKKRVVWKVGPMSSVVKRLALQWKGKGLVSCGIGRRMRVCAEEVRGGAIGNYATKFRSVILYCD